MNELPPLGPKKTQSSHPPVKPPESKGPVEQVPAGEKYLPAGVAPAGTPLENREVSHWKGSVPSITPPSQYLGANAKDYVLELLQRLAPEIDTGQVRSVSQSRKQEMAQRITKINAALAQDDLQRVLKTTQFLAELESTSDPSAITSKTALALALRIEQAQQEVLAKINAKGADAGVKTEGLLEYQTLHNAWKELHAVVSDICANAPPVIFQPVSPPPVSRQNSSDSGFGDMEPWTHPAPLPSPQSLLPQLEDQEHRIKELEQKLERQEETQKYRHTEQQLRTELQDNRRQLDQMRRSNSELTRQNQNLLENINTLQNRPVMTDTRKVTELEQRIESFARENDDLKLELEKQRSIIQERSKPA